MKKKAAVITGDVERGAERLRSVLEGAGYAVAFCPDPAAAEAFPAALLVEGVTDPARLRSALADADLALLEGADAGAEPAPPSADGPVATAEAGCLPRGPGDLHLLDIIEASFNEIYVVDRRSLKFLYANPSALRNLGLSLAELRSMTPAGVMPDYSGAGLARLLAPLLDGRKDRLSFAASLERRDGTRYPVEVHVQPAGGRGEEVFLAVAHDLSGVMAATDALRWSEARFRAVFENAAVGIGVVDKSERYTMTNERLRAILGYSEEELAALTSMDITHPDDLGKSRACLDSLLRGELPMYSIEKRYLRKGGGAFWADLSVSPIKGPSGAIESVVCMVRDVSERKAMEAEIARGAATKEALLRELQHRVKNNLNVIDSLLGLEVGKLADPRARAVFQDAQARIRSMAGLYERLHDSASPDRVDLAPYLDALARSLLDTYGVVKGRVTLAASLEPAAIDMKRGVLVGLIVNELIANALKYAYPAGAAGEVRLALRAAGGRGEISVADDGPGLPPGFDLAGAKSLGMRLVATLAADIDAELAVESRPGLRVALRFAL